MKVYKYRTATVKNEEGQLRNFVSLKENKLYASHKNKLNDPCETITDNKHIDQMEKSFEVLLNNNNYAQAVIDGVKQIFEFKDKGGIYSLAKTSIDELLWAHYADSHKGFVIEYDFNRLLEFFGNYALEVIHVQYLKDVPVIDPKDFFKKEELLKKLFGTKSKMWEYEKEIRLFFNTHGFKEYDYRAVTGIYFGLGMDDKLKDELQKTMKGRGIKYYQIYLIENSYKLDIYEVEDTYIEAEPYNTNVGRFDTSLISDNSIIGLKGKEFLKYKEFLFMAAEQVRKEPYCKEIVDVFFTSDCSINNPKIYVQEKIYGDSYRVVNHHFKIEDDNIVKCDK